MSVDIYNAKHGIRREMMSLRKQLNPEEKQRMDEAICSRILETLEEIFIADSRSVYCYVSCGTEIDTLNLIQKLWKQGVAVAVPRVDDTEENRMNFYWITCMEDLVPGYKGILEPATHCQKAGDKYAPVITPGLAFTKNGARLGYGGGYYDRFFACEPEHTRIGLAYPFQILEELPTEETDFRIQRIITG